MDLIIRFDCHCLGGILYRERLFSDWRVDVRWLGLVIDFSADGTFDFTGRREKHRFHLF